MFSYHLRRGVAYLIWTEDRPKELTRVWANNNTERGHQVAGCKKKEPEMLYTGHNITSRTVTNRPLQMFSLQGIKCQWEVESLVGFVNLVVGLMSIRRIMTTDQNMESLSCQHYLSTNLAYCCDNNTKESCKIRFGKYKSSCFTFSTISLAWSHREQSTIIILPSVIAALAPLIVSQFT